MPRRAFPMPKGVQKVNFSTRAFRSDYLDRLRAIAMQQGAVGGCFYPLEQTVNDVLGAGLRVFEPWIAEKFKEYQKKRRSKKVLRAL